MNGFWFWRKRGLRWIIGDHIRCNRWFYCALLAVFFGGFLVGLLTSGGAVNWLFVDNSLKYFYRLFNRGFNFFGHFFSRFFANLQFVFMVSLLSLHVFCFPLQQLYIFYRGFVFGIAVSVIIRLFGITGVVNSAVIIIPMQIVIMFTLFFCCVTGDSRSLNCYLTGDYYFFWRSTRDFCRILLNVVIVSAAICLIECLLITAVAYPLNSVFL